MSQRFTGTPKRTKIIDSLRFFHLFLNSIIGLFFKTQKHRFGKVTCYFQLFVDHPSHSTTVVIFSKFGDDQSFGKFRKKTVCPLTFYDSVSQ